MQDKTEIDLLKDELAQVREELVGLKGEGKSNHFDFTKKLNDEDVLNNFQEEFSKIKEKTDSISLELKEQVKQNPLQSISIAFTLGLLLSKVFGGRK